MGVPGGLFGASILITLYLMKKDPALLKRRLSAGPTAEKEKTQKIIMLLASIGFIGALVVPGLDHRFLWSSVPFYAVIAGDALAALCFLITFLVYKENTFTSATIEIAEDQTKTCSCKNGLSISAPEPALMDDLDPKALSVN